MNDENLGLLRVLLLLLSERSVSRVAVRLGVSQPAISHSLKRLRKMFDDPLLLRSGAGLIPTERALALVPQIERLMGDYARLLEPPGAFNPTESRRNFVITAPEYGETRIVPALFRQIRAAAPGVTVEVRAPAPDRALIELEKGEIDLRIAWLTAATPSLRAMQLFEDRLVCIADLNHPSIRGVLTVEHLLGFPHARTLGTSHVTTVRVIDEALARLGKRLSKTFLVQHFPSIPPMIVGTDIIATLPRRQALTYAVQYPLQVLDLPLRLPRVSYAAYWHERSHHDPGHRWFRQQIRRAVRSEPPSS